jgi:hypothetical protein
VNRDNCVPIQKKESGMRIIAIFAVGMPPYRHENSQFFQLAKNLFVSVIHKLKIGCRKSDAIGTVGLGNPWPDRALSGFHFVVLGPYVVEESDDGFASTTGEMRGQ